MKRNLLSCKWMLNIILLLSEKPYRPSEIKRNIKGLKERVMYDRLSKLVEAGIVGKEASKGYPKETYYYLLERGEITALLEWLRTLNVPVEIVSSVFSCKWTPQILELLKAPSSPKSIKLKIEGISDKVLHERLRELQEIELVERRVIPTKPVSVVYELSEEGKRLLPHILKTCELIACK